MNRALLDTPAEIWAALLPGMTRRNTLRATRSDDGVPVDVPIVAITGTAPGPRVALVAGVHGDEVEGQFALQRLVEVLAPTQVSGTIVMVLCANPLAARAGRRCMPEDGHDLNRVFPGDPQGSVSQRLASAVFSLVREADYLMTLHSWYVTGNVLPYVEYPAVCDATTDASAAAASACGLDRVMPLDWHPGLLPAAAVRAGVRAVEVEIGGLGQCTADGQVLYEMVLRRFLAHAGALADAGDLRSRPRTIRGYHLTAPVAGLLQLRVELGETVSAGQPLATVIGIDGRVRAVLEAPVAGEVGAMRLFAPVGVGDQVVSVFQTITPLGDAGQRVI